MRVVLGHYKTEAKSNEITAIPKLLKCLDIEGCVVTIDAMAISKIAKQIHHQGADYVLGVKGNQGTLHQTLIKLFEEVDTRNYDAMWYQTHETIDGEHDRIETRRTTILPLMYLHSFKLKWKGLQSIASVENQRQIGKHTSREFRYYITSLPPDAKRIGSAIRQHWSRVSRYAHEKFRPSYPRNLFASRDYY